MYYGADMKMKRVHKTTVFMIIFSLSPLGALPSAGAGKEVVEVVRVVDGDTVLIEGGRYVRLIQVDAPELGKECYAEKSFSLLIDLVEGKRVRLEREIKASDEDSYGRLLRYLHVGKMNVNLEMVKRGGAAPWFFGSIKGKYAKKLLRASKVAGRSNTGVWGECPAAKLNVKAAFDTGMLPKLKSNDITSSKTIIPGSYCPLSSLNQTGFSKAGKMYTCIKGVDEDKPRWMLH